MFAEAPRRFTLQVLSPLHIGTGDTLDPLAYAALRCREQGRYVPIVEVYDLARAVQLMAPGEREHLERFLAAEKFVALRAWLGPLLFGGKEFSPAVIRSVDADEEVVTTYEREVAGDRSALEIHPALIDPLRGTPMIPGSSVKGALRTAWLNRLLETRGLRIDGLARKSVEVELLGDPRTDPFRALGLSDVASSATASLVTRVINVRRGGIEQTRGVEARPGFRMFFEFLQPQPEGEAEACVGALGFSTRAPLGRQLRPGAAPASVEELLAAARSDAARELERELGFFGELNAAGRFAKRLRQELDGLGPRGTLLKLGRFGGVYSKTLEGVRSPVTRRGRSGALPWGTTRFLVRAAGAGADDWTSCGWCRLTVQ
ncbi:MAG: hypothetical protein HZA54_11405 [Planctomycetes bacterium]|nr:hypothetical protein [Planctomycetota bacterium]